MPTQQSNFVFVRPGGLAGRQAVPTVRPSLRPSVCPSVADTLGEYLSRIYSKTLLKIIVVNAQRDSRRLVGGRVDSLKSKV